MNGEICRAITFINYHIPVVLHSEIDIQYSTIGFFDAMCTEMIPVSYESDELKFLWRYNLRQTKKSMGRYSFQNIFCFSKDAWNHFEDTAFWDENTDSHYPLNFVVLLQLRNYRTEEDTIKKQCEDFNSVLKECISETGLYYTYCTIDKNDFVVCLKSKDYKKVVEAIKQLHSVGGDVVYSYSIFSIYSKVLEAMEEEKYPDIFTQTIDSICLKGITNSFDPLHSITLDMKYREFCENLVERLYEEEKAAGQEVDYKIYDILGDNDFRLIARHVRLGALLKQFASGGLLSYKEKKFRFYLFSSNLVLNTLTPHYNKIGKDYKEDSIDRMEMEFVAPLCDKLQKRMKQIADVVLSAADMSSANEKIMTFSYAIWQLLQSLKPLEIAPTKKYDFWSLYKPLSLMIDILEEKMEIMNGEQRDFKYDISENVEIYDFIHKISMTLHGTLRTDIQFFQIRDFNSIVHYAPAKLRAFYALWVLKLSEFYNDFSEVKNQYSFAFSPGMFRETSVKQLFINYDEKKRMMLITVPERHLYSPKWLSVILAHEVSHFVGYKVRNRKLRHMFFLEGCARVLTLEINFYRYTVSSGQWKADIEKGVSQNKLFKEIKQQLFEEENVVRNEKRLWPHEFHSENSFEVIRCAFRNVAKGYLKKLVSDDCGLMNIFLKEEENIYNMALREQTVRINEIRRASYDIEPYLLALYQKFQHNMLTQLLQMFRYVITEAYADLMAILTLNLTAEKYLLSFINGEQNLNEKNLLSGIDMPLIVRLAITIRAVEEAVKMNGERFFDLGFRENWGRDVIRTLAREFDHTRMEGLIALKIYGYTTGIRDCNKKIGDYKSLYNYAKEVEDFTNSQLDFFNDQCIWNGMVGYLSKCAEDYIHGLGEDTMLVEKKRDLEIVYKDIEKGELSVLVQRIEDFLAFYEKSCVFEKN